MSSKDPDFLFTFSEQFLNKSLKMAFTQNLFSREFSGIHIVDVPGFLSRLKEIKYRVVMRQPPTVDAIKSSELKISVTMLCELEWGLNYNTVFDTEAEILTDPEYNQSLGTLDLNVKDIQLQSIKFREGANVPGFLMGLVNSAISSILTQSVWQENERIPLLPLVSYIELPEMPEGVGYQLPLFFLGVEVINEKAVLLAFNLSEEQMNIPLKNESEDAELSLGISENAINRVISHWWKNTSHPKTEKISGSVEVQHLDTIVNHFSNLSFELGLKVASLGFLESDFKVERAWVEYVGNMKIGSPSVALSPDAFKILGRVEVIMEASLKIDVKIESRIDTSSIIPDRLTPWKDDRVLRSTNRVVTIQKMTNKRVSIDLSGMKAKVVVGKDGELNAELTEFDVDLDIDWNIPKRLKKRFEASLEKTVMENYPVLPISSSLLNQKIKGSEIRYIIKPLGVVTDVGAVEIRMNLDYV